jgi:hypothetical protein
MLTPIQSRSMDLWTAALKWAMDFDSIASRHYAAVAADAESLKLNSPVPVDALILRSSAVASPATPRQFSLGRDSLAIPLDDDVKRLPVHLYSPPTFLIAILAGASASTRRARPPEAQSHASTITGLQRSLASIPPCFTMPSVGNSRHRESYE